ncbi:MAG: ROK family protein [Planktothrix sp.]|uniref:ROK family protein n=1 Tax=Planktothrix sp. TaxID=3088171 RepID=UPI0038D4904B
MNVEVIGIDLGGTAIKLGRFGSDGTCYQCLSFPTPQPATPDQVIDAITDAVRQLRKNVNNIVAMGLGTPGPVDGTGKIAKVAINLAGWHDVPLGWVLEEKTGLPVILANDANCAGLGEAWLGAGRRFQNLILLTLGTGVGGAIILNGELFVGHQGAAGELGLISINFEGPICNSGNRGSLEQYTSVQAIRRDTGLEPAELAEKALAGDQKAISYWQDYGKLLGVGLANLIYVLTPEAIILGGGISAGSDLFLPAMKAELEQRVLFSSREGLEILIAELGNQAGMIGAAKLAFQKLVKIEDQLKS